MYLTDYTDLPNYEIPSITILYTKSNKSIINRLTVSIYICISPNVCQ